jgi:hypothetical protein
MALTQRALIAAPWLCASVVKSLPQIERPGPITLANRPNHHPRSAWQHFIPPGPAVPPRDAVGH